MGFLKAVLIFIALFFLTVAGLGWYLAPRDNLKKADAIVAISGGDTKARTETASKLYSDGWSKQLVVSGAAADPNSVSNAVQMRQIAINEGVPATAIRTENDSKDTKENADKVASTFKVAPKTIILVTSPYHQRRAYEQFEMAFPKTEIINYPAFDKTWRRSLWWVTPSGWYLTISESAKLIFINSSK
jgi:uncharacterized SAM-binding protein YcdF (DUF218 family)